jgi:mono/diheme cytochrome c family protein
VIRMVGFRRTFSLRLHWHTAPALLLWALIAGCDRHDMYDQPRYEPLEASSFFRDGLSARPRVEGTIPRGGLREDQAYYTGKENGKLIRGIPEPAYRAIFDRDPQTFKQPYEETKPAEIRRALLERGRERFYIHCSVCHGRTGDGNGMIVLRGFRKPPSYHIDRLRQVPAGHIFDVMSHGFGAMSSYASRIDIDDRWAIVAYVRALQLSQSALFEDVPTELRNDLVPQRRNANDVPISTRENAR